VSKTNATETGAVGAFMVVATLCLTACTPFVVQSQPTDPAVSAPVRMGGDTLLWGLEIKPQALQMIRSSTRFCHLTMYELSDPDILQALAQAAKRGVAVEVVLDAKEPHSLSTGLPYLTAHHVKVRTLSIPGGISHIKSLVTEDGKGMHALLGGMNFGAFSWENHDASVYLSRPGASFEGLFEQDYARADGAESPSVWFAPPLLYDSQIKPAMLQAISSARQTISIEAFAFTDRSLIAALAAAVSRGVTVRVLLDPKQSYNHKTATELATAGVQVRYYAAYNGEYLHAKLISVDSGRFVFIGSANFSYHGFTINHEGDLEFRDAPAFGRSIDADAANQYWRGQS